MDIGQKAVGATAEEYYTQDGEAVSELEAIEYYKDLVNNLKSTLSAFESLEESLKDIKRKKSQ